MKRVAISVAIPILVLLLWVASIHLSIVRSTEIRVRVQGYDPRDLLAGHYINFTLNLGENNPCLSHRDQTACICFAPEATGVYHTAFWSGSCSEMPNNCTIFVAGLCNGNRFESGTERYSIPERLAPVLNVVPPDSSIALSTNSSGEAHVLRFYAGEELLENYAEQKLLELIKTPRPEEDTK